MPYELLRRSLRVAQNVRQDTVSPLVDQIATDCRREEVVRIWAAKQLANDGGFSFAESNALCHFSNASSDLPSLNFAFPSAFSFVAISRIFNFYLDFTVERVDLALNLPNCFMQINPL